MNSVHSLSNKEVIKLPNPNFTKKQSIITSKPPNLNNFQCFSGVIRGEWYKSDGRLQSICYGTGIAISRRIVLTCAHSVYLEKKRKLCDTVSFIPNHPTGRVERKDKIYKTEKMDFIQLQTINENQTFSKFPIPEDIALIYLSEDLDLDDFPEVGVDSLQELAINSEIMISGYPSLDYYSCSSLGSIDFRRITLKGELLEVNDNVLYHNLQTSTGHSGSGVIGHNSRTNQVTVLGVHTHKGKRRNSGVFLSDFLMKRLARYEIEFGLSHKEYDMSIKFPQRIKEQAFQALAQEEKANICQRNKIYLTISTKNQKNEVEQQDYQNSEMLPIFSDEDQNFIQDEDELNRIIREHGKEYHQNQQKINKNQQIRKLFDANDKLKEEILANPNSDLDLLQRWLKVQNTFLQIFSSISEINTKISSKKEKTIKQLIGFCTQVQEQLSQLKEKVKSINKIDVICLKFSTVAQHLSRYFSQQIDINFGPNDDDEFLKVDQPQCEPYFQSCESTYIQQRREENQERKWSFKPSSSFVSEKYTKYIESKLQ